MKLNIMFCAELLPSVKFFLFSLFPIALPLLLDSYTSDVKCYHTVKVILKMIASMGIRPKTKLWRQGETNLIS